MRILRADHRKTRTLAALGFAGALGLTSLGLAPAASAAAGTVTVQNVGPVSQGYWEYVSYYRSFDTSQECVDFAYSKLRPKTWAICVYAEYGGQSGWFATFMGTNQ